MLNTLIQFNHLIILTHFLLVPVTENQLLLHNYCVICKEKTFTWAQSSEDWRVQSWWPHLVSVTAWSDFTVSSQTQRWDVSSLRNSAAPTSVTKVPVLHLFAHECPRGCLCSFPNKPPTWVLSHGVIYLEPHLLFLTVRTLKGVLSWCSRSSQKEHLRRELGRGGNLTNFSSFPRGRY